LVAPAVLALYRGFPTVSNLQTLRRLQSLGTGDGSVDWKSATQQVGNLRYFQRTLNRSQGEGITRDHPSQFLRPSADATLVWATKTRAAGWIRG